MASTRRSAGKPLANARRSHLPAYAQLSEPYVVERGKDRYGRPIGGVTCATVEANSEQVRRGMAWVFDRYVASDSPLYKLQSEAQAIRRGLWRIHQRRSRLGNGARRAQVAVRRIRHTATEFSKMAVVAAGG